jgi:Homeodomain-like domain
VVVIDHAEAAVRPPAVDAVEERKIRKRAGARHAPADWIRRAQIIALSWDGLRVPAIAAALGCSQKAVRYRLARFATEGLDRPGVRARAKSSDGRLTCLDAGVERLRSGAHPGPSRRETDRQVAPTWARVKCSPCR